MKRLTNDFDGDADGWRTWDSEFIVAGASAVKLSPLRTRARRLPAPNFARRA